VNFAIDRRARAAAQQSGFGAVPSDQYLPPLIAGFRDAHIYPLDRPDLVRASRLAGRGNRKAVLYTCDSPDCLEQAQVLTRNLAAIGIQLKVDAFSENVLAKKETSRGASFDLASTNWTTDAYYDPSTFPTFCSTASLRTCPISRTRSSSGGSRQQRSSPVPSAIAPTPGSTPTWPRTPPRP
jgi:ABC-type transport system substrate-binding protein